jgi:hypothetical protein
MIDSPLHVEVNDGEFIKGLAQVISADSTYPMWFPVPLCKK